MSKSKCTNTKIIDGRYIVKQITLAQLVANPQLSIQTWTKWVEGTPKNEVTPVTTW